MSLPPANLDLRIPQIRSITETIYTLLFSSFTTISKLTSIYNSIATGSNDKNLKDDVAWLKESIDKDIEKLNALQNHLQFLRADETITTPSELIQTFNEITDFAQMILLDDLITTLKGISTVTDELVIDGISLKDVVIRLQKFAISLKLTTEPIKKYKDQDQVTSAELSEVEKVVQSRALDLSKRIQELKEVVN